MHFKKIMKLFAFIVVLALVVTNAEEAERRRSYKDLLIEVTSPHRSECICASGIDDNEAETWMQHSKPENFDPCTKCYIKCVHMMSGMMASDGSYDINEMVKLGFDRFEARYCNEMTSEEDDLCVKAYKLNQCFVRLDNKDPKSEEYEGAEEDFDVNEFDDLDDLDEHDEHEESDVDDHVDVENSENNNFDEFLENLELEDSELKESEDDEEWDIDFDDLDLE